MMGIYTFITEQDRIEKRKVDDPEVNDLLQEALRCCPSLMIEQRERANRCFFKRGKSVSFAVLHEVPAHNGSAYQARYHIIGSGSKEVTMAYLCGIINGYFNPPVGERRDSE